MWYLDFVFIKLMLVIKEVITGFFEKEIKVP
jgi:hypothetical protein